MTDEQREERNRKRREEYRERIMTDQQRAEQNRKRREAYKKEKSHAVNKENDPVGGVMAQHSMGSDLLKGKSGKKLRPLNSVDTNIEVNKKKHNNENDPVGGVVAEHSNIQWVKSVDSKVEINKKGCKGYRKKDDETDRIAISAEQCESTSIIIQLYSFC